MEEENVFFFTRTALRRTEANTIELYCIKSLNFVNWVRKELQHGHGTWINQLPPYSTPLTLILMAVKFYSGEMEVTFL